MPKNYERYLEIIKGSNDESDCEQLEFESNNDEEGDEYEC